MSSLFAEVFAKENSVAMPNLLALMVNRHPILCPADRQMTLRLANHVDGCHSAGSGSPIGRLAFGHYFFGHGLILAEPLVIVKMF